MQVLKYVYFNYIIFDQLLRFQRLLELSWKVICSIFNVLSYDIEEINGVCVNLSRIIFQFFENVFKKGFR